MLKIKVKASSLTNLTDARYFAAREVEWLGFALGTGEGMVEPVKVRAMAEWVGGVKIVGEFGLEKAEEIIDVQKYIGLDAVQVNMFWPIAELKKLAGLAVIKEVVTDMGFSQIELEKHLDAYSPHCDSFLLNLAASGHTWPKLEQGHPFSIEFLKSICQKHRIILNLDCTAAEIDKLLSELAPYALSLNGGEEEKVGLKSFDELDGLLDQLEIEKQ